MRKLKLPTTNRGIFFVVLCFFGSLCLLSYGLPWLWHMLKPLRDNIDAFNHNPTVILWCIVIFIVMLVVWIAVTAWLGIHLNPRRSPYESLRDRLKRQRTAR